MTEVAPVPLSPMNPENLDRFLDKIFAEWSQDAAQSPLRAYFPALVIERLRASSVPLPVQFSQYLKRLETETELEDSFAHGLFSHNSSLSLDHSKCRSNAHSSLQHT
jgi:hypothetical protein